MEIQNWRNSCIRKSIFSQASLDSWITSINKTKQVNNNSMNFIYEPEEEGKNIIWNNSSVITYISIDWAIQKIGENDIKYDDKWSKAICWLFKIFIKGDIFISKLISAFYFFYEKYPAVLEEQRKKDLFNVNCNDSANAVLETYIPSNWIRFISAWIKMQWFSNWNDFSVQDVGRLKGFYSDIANISCIKKTLSSIVEDTIADWNCITQYHCFLSNSNDNCSNSSSSSSSNNNKFNPFNININATIPKSYSYREFKQPGAVTQSKPFDFLALKPQWIAAELTRISFYYFNKIEYKEFFFANYSKQNKRDKESPNITFLNERYNKWSFWIIEEVLSYDHKNTRAAVIEKIIDVALHLKEWNNFFDLLAIYFGLNHYILRNWLLTWNCLSNEYKSKFNNLSTYLTMEGNFKNIREDIDKFWRDNTISYLPFLGWYTGKITYWEEEKYVNNPNDNLINCNKIKQWFTVLSEFFRFKKSDYWFTSNNEGKWNILQCIKPKTEEEWDKLSGLLEPKFKLNSKARDVKRMSNSDYNYNNVKSRNNYKFI